MPAAAPTAAPLPGSCVIRPEDYAQSPAHHAVALGDDAALRRLLSRLPRLAHPSTILTPSDALHQSRLADAVSSLLDRRDGVPRRDTPLHLAVRLSLPTAAALLLSAGADPSLQNSDGWTPLHLSLSLRRRLISPLLLRHHRLSAWSKFRRRVPSLLPALRSLPDFYLELSFHFESPVIPFLHYAAPSDTYRIWKRGGDVRADTSLAGFDGIRVRRADQSFLFLASVTGSLPAGSLLVLNRSERKVYDAFDGADSSTEYDDGLSGDCAYRPGLDITAAELVRRTNWRGKDKVEMVGEWKARVYDIHNVVFSFKTMRAVAEEEEEVHGSQEVLPLNLTEDAEEGFLVAELPPRHSCYEQRGRRSTGATLEKAELGRRSVDVVLPSKEQDRSWERMAAAAERTVVGKCKEKEMVKNLKPTVWLTEDFPLETEEFLPLLDILANKVKAVWRLRELLTTKFPPGTFPVKVAIPIIPTVRVVVTFTKFVYLQPPEQFYTPLSSPRHLSLPEEEQHLKAETGNHKSSWLKWNNSSTPRTPAARSKFMSTSQVVDHADPFTIPSDYTWISINSKDEKMKKSKSRKGKYKEIG